MTRVIGYTVITLLWGVWWLWVGMSLQSAVLTLLPTLVFALVFDLTDKPFNDWWARRNGQKASTQPRQ